MTRIHSPNCTPKYCLHPECLVDEHKTRWTVWIQIGGAAGSSSYLLVHFT